MIDIHTSIDELADCARDNERTLSDEIAKAGLPFIVYETRRTAARQSWLYASGRTRAGAIVTNADADKSPHVHGLAVDRVLNILDPRWSDHGIDDRPCGPWDVGYFATVGVGPRTAKVLRPSVLAAWKAFGVIAMGCGLEWGGAWKKRGCDSDPIGWDPAHTQVKDWRKWVGK